jgi:protein TonB
MIFTSDLLEPRGKRVTRWIGAAALVLAAHVGCTALALMHLQEEESEDAAASSLIIEMVPTPVAVRTDTPDVAHGPLMEEAKQSPQAVKETKEVVEKEKPPVEESPLAAKPEVVLPVPRPVKEEKPEEEKEKEETPQQQSVEQAMAAPLTTAPPRVEAKEEPTATAPAPGTSATSARALVTWEKALVSHLNRFKRYPDAARAGGSQGAVSVEFTLDRAGRVLGSRVVRSSGSPALDGEALAVLQRASPLPAPPGQIAGPTFDLRLPIQFRIR